MSEKANAIDTAYDCLKKAGKPVPFVDLFAEVASILNIPETHKRKKKASLYGELSMDNRFRMLEGNIWDLAENYTFEEKHSVKEEEQELDDEEEAEETEQYGLDLPTGADDYN